MGVFYASLGRKSMRLAARLLGKASDCLERGLVHPRLPSMKKPSVLDYGLVGQALSFAAISNLSRHSVGSRVAKPLVSLCSQVEQAQASPKVSPFGARFWSAVTCYRFEAEAFALSPRLAPKLVFESSGPSCGILRSHGKPKRPVAPACRSSARS